MPPRSTTVSNNDEHLEATATTELGASKQTGVLFEADADTVDGALAVDITQFKKAEKRKLKLVWRNIILFGYLHLAALYGGYLFFAKAKWATVFFSIFLYSIGVLGITAGAHRLWAHRSYKAKWPLRLILIVFNTVAFQDAAYHWARDHRVHHKFSETDADPHNATRGFFFSHVGWLLCKKHPDVVAKGKSLDLSDLRADPILMFQKKHYMTLMPLACFILPTVIPMYLWNESFLNAWFVATMFRWCFLLNVTWCVNSAAHKFGGRPYDKNINPSQNAAVAAFAFGEGWHNYHHVFPWDYKTAEWGNYSMNLTTAFIDFFAKIGWAYDLKSVAPETIEKRVKRTGDGTHELWGYGDKDITAEDKESIITLNKKTE
ncbi:acyl-CoA Delta(11) desaturase-like [Lucilia sericata]|uniref:acyl-CoA Delta(11) desaturase-like n=1 Tax=Lucilia sericata TaxID=13632 RepID=UPI0018A86800|nr:acyl-CoA Delta(11) desaturase-like [Lucilia sericata]XP_037809621.1 acyl-CoA Delta(11) desaturase-like [Lucilia sericata]XP_037809622.1 acyl-CoA Delta(11) desaturase-like [Lucilia sericata]XP_037809623.1 acyl-CoA Delta(11) desaturase-like [Lucilia sericata]XP_037809624.1 acyl-CoA Delta(11) desaturase-like [Lucilia sericata]